MHFIPQENSVPAHSAHTSTNVSCVNLKKDIQHSYAETGLTTKTQTALPTPINNEILAELLIGYSPDEENFLKNGFSNGFSLQCDKPYEDVTAKNHQSVHEMPQTALDLINKEIELNRISGPHEEKPFPVFQISPLKLQPKKDPGKFRLIHNLSAPYDAQAINFNISEENSTVQYANIQNAIEKIQQLGPNCFLAKSDIQSAFRLIPVSPDDYPRLGFVFKNKYYFDRCLAQGYSSSCQIFERFSSSLEWILKNKFGVKHCLHVLDDFLFIGHTFEECKNYLTAWETLCSMINVPLAKDKTVGPSQELVFLGIHLSTINMMAKLPDDKLQCYNEKLENLLHVRTVKLSTMQSVIGCLQFATNVVLPGKAFVRRLIDTVIGISKPFHYVTITPEARADIRMWHLFFKFHNGKTLFLSTKKENSLTLNMYSDASKMACAATFNSDWFVIEFPSEWQKKNIAFLEFYPIVVAIQIFGIKMANRYVNFHCDNKAIVQVINKQSCKDGEIMKLTRQMVLTAMQYNIKFSASHVPGKFNNLADALSRLQVSPQLLRAHGMREQPVQVPQRLQPNNFRPI